MALTRDRTTRPARTRLSLTDWQRLCAFYTTPGWAHSTAAWLTKPHKRWCAMLAKPRPRCALRMAAEMRHDGHLALARACVLAHRRRRLAAAAQNLPATSDSP